MSTIVFCVPLQSLYFILNFKQNNEFKTFVIDISDVFLYLAGKRLDQN